MALASATGVQRGRDWPQNAASITHNFPKDVTKHSCLGLRAGLVGQRECAGKRLQLQCHGLGSDILSHRRQQRAKTQTKDTMYLNACLSSGLQKTSD